MVSVAVERPFGFSAVCWVSIDTIVLTRVVSYRILHQRLFGTLKFHAEHAATGFCFTVFFLKNIFDCYDISQLFQRIVIAVFITGKFLINEHMVS